MTTVARAVHIAGRGLASSLGPDLASALRALGEPLAQPSKLRGAGPGEPGWPFRAIDAALAPGRDAWLQRARQLVLAVVAESGRPTSPDAPLFIASSSLDVGAIEAAALVPTGLGLLDPHAPYEVAAGCGPQHTTPPCVAAGCACATTALDVAPAAAATAAAAPAAVELAESLQQFAQLVAGWLGWTGPVVLINTACTSAINALLGAQAWLSDGRADEALVLGIELANRLAPAGFSAMQLLAPEQALPLTAQRQGIVLGEAVAALRLSCAPSRWRLAGGANVVDGANPTGCSASAVAAMVDQAMSSAGITPARLDLIKLQAAGSPGNDAAEISALRSCLLTPQVAVVAPLAGPSRRQLPPLVTLKAELGHTLGASGAAEIALLCACLDAGVWPHSARHHEPDPALDVHLAPAAPPQLRYLLACILGFGGGHAAVVLERLDDAAVAALAPPATLQLPPGWTCLARFDADPPPPDWRSELVTRLGSRPRRIGLWAELALYGASHGLGRAGLDRLPPKAALRVASRHGPALVAQTIAQGLAGLPMPFDFLQSLPSQMLAALGVYLRWQGDARFVAGGDDAEAIVDLACGDTDATELLVGLVDDQHGLTSRWWWMRRTS